MQRMSIINRQRMLRSRYNIRAALAPQIPRYTYTGTYNTRYATAPSSFTALTRGAGGQISRNLRYIQGIATAHAPDLAGYCATSIARQR